MLLQTATSSFVLLDIYSTSRNTPPRETPLSPDKLEQLQKRYGLLRLMHALRIPICMTWLAQAQPPAQDQALTALCNHLFERNVFNACEAGLTPWLHEVGTPSSQGNQRSLPKHLQKPKVLTRTQVVMAGDNIHAGLLQTALSLLEEDFDVWLITDLCDCDDKTDLEATLDRLASNGVDLITANMAAAEWAQHPDHAAYAQWASSR